MPYALYVCLQDEDKIMAFTMDATTGQLTPTAAVPVAGGPSGLTLSPDRQVLYVGHRTGTAISSFRIDPGSGGLTPSGTVALEAAPTFMATDRTGRFLLSAYYQGAHVAVHPLGGDGAVGALTGRPGPGFQPVPQALVRVVLERRAEVDAAGDGRGVVTRRDIRPQRRVLRRRAAVIRFSPILTFPRKRGKELRGWARPARSWRPGGRGPGRSSCHRGRPAGPSRPGRGWP